MTESKKSVLQLVCSGCGQTVGMQLHNWCCDRCGAAWLPVIDQPLDPDKIHASAHDIWRFADWMGLQVEIPVRLGAGGTPLIETNLNSRRVFFKAEYQNPSGSFKDRGVETMVSALQKLGATRVVEDSSGNAGASMAAYAARAGLQAEIYAPETASAVKLAQIGLYGAQVKRIPGARENSTRAVLEAVQGGAVYASHAWNPAYLLGQQTAAWEVWEQLGRRVPDWWVVPVGQGGHLLGIWLGFQRLLQSSLTERLPRMVVVQSEAVAPLSEAIQTQKLQIEPVQAGKKTVAEGVVVTSPVRSTHILAEAKRNDWLGVTIHEEDILPARQQLAQTGIFVEPTSALAVAALPMLYSHSRPDDIIVVSLTGSGLKVPIS